MSAEMAGLRRRDLEGFLQAWARAREGESHA